MTVPRLPAFDAKTFSQRLFERVLSATGKPYTVFDPEDDAGNAIGFPRFIQGLRGQRDIVASHDVQLGDHKKHLDALDARMKQAEADIAALEAQPKAPFPVSG